MFTCFVYGVNVEDAFVGRSDHLDDEFTRGEGEFADFGVESL
jgi:hypothetical protein